MQDLTNTFKNLHGLENKELLPSIKKNIKSTNEYSGGRIKNEALFQVINILTMEFLVIEYCLFQKLKKIQKMIKGKKKSDPFNLWIQQM